MDGIKIKQSIEDRTLEILTYQLGRRPRGEIKIGATCSYGAPSVIICPPILGDEYFPTTYWLSCPTRKKKVSRLESDSWISKLQNELDIRADWQSRLKQAIEKQIAVRRGLIDIDDSKAADMISSGIGGTAESFNIKCIHAHLADYMISKINPVGEKTANLTGEIQCDGECVIEKSGD